jgi:FixJ family two-component response regulator
MKSKPTVFVVDDDQEVRRSLKWLIESVGLRVETYPSAPKFLDAYDPADPGCLVLDVRMPGMSGIELQEKLNAQHIDIPIVFITAHGDVPMAVRAVKSGAIDFVEKPFNDQVLLDCIQTALDEDTRNRRQWSERAEVIERLAPLTRRERQVMNMVAAGMTNKEIAVHLKVSRKTIEAHRANLMKKLEVDSVAEIVQLALAAESKEQKP